MGGAKKPKIGGKLKVKIGAKAKGKVSVKKPKTKLKVKVGAKAKKMRRLQTSTPATTPAATMNVSPTGVNLASPAFAANVKMPTGLAGDGQVSPAKSWMIYTGLMMFVAVLLN